MALILQWCRAIADSWVGTEIRESDNLFSAIETLHVLGVTASAGVIAIVDLAVLRQLFVRYSVREVLEPLVKITWIGFALMAISGIFLFCSEADKLYFNAAFRVKMLLLLALGVNQWLFHHRFGSAARSDGRIAAALSLGLWTGVIVLGRAIAYL